MKTLRIIFLMVLAFVGHSLYGYSQNNISIALTSESIAFPFTRFLPIHPGIEIGSTFKTISNSNGESQLNGYVGYYYHERISNSFYVRGEYLKRFVPLKHIGFDLMGGLGYQHSFYPDNLFKQDMNGDYEKNNHMGNPAILINVGAGLSYTQWDKLEPFLKYEFTVQTPFANGIPFLPHTIFKLGFNYKF